MRKLTIIVSFLFSLINVSINAEGFASFEDLLFFLTDDEKATLLNNGELTIFTMGDFQLELTPPVENSTVIVEEIASGKMTVGIEGLFLFKEFPMDYFFQHKNSAMTYLYNKLNAVSTLKDLEYYSASRERMRTLFEESYVINDPINKKALPDLVFNTPPNYNSYYIHQKDSSFGKSESKVVCRMSSDNIVLTIINSTPLYYSVVKAIEAEDMQIHLIVIPTDKGILFYGVCGAKTVKMKALEERASKSFYNRVKALYGWYTGSLNSEELRKLVNGQ